MVQDENFDEFLCGFFGRLCGKVFVYDVNADAYQNQGNQTLQGECLVLFFQQNSAQDHAEYGVHEAEYSNLAYRVVLEQNAPQRVGHSGNQRHVNQQHGGLEGKAVQLAAHGNADHGHDDAAQCELIAAEGDGVIPLTIGFDEDGRECVGQSGQEDRTLAHQGHGTAQSGLVQVDKHYAGKAQQAADDLSLAQLLIVEQQAGNQDGQKYVGSLNDGSLYAGGVGKTDVEQQILDNGLCHGKFKDHAPRGFGRD